ncbi:hydroxysqualene dehydroxylase HpnE [Frankia sp. AgPm24]|uniref:hydroxysqualene dehydroxylase HpnE n=1 Tax=Frankia sp. AgPm24 TaxID=631128 RepID=UPI00200F7229|nr:hydroxysqualene dehydroxylase HpnE [Frankia sp. AgPm24]MCK9924265.1 hydroxysqualene dehydroxylase HpnE [Frankia sp. AgPm24]
MSAAGTDGQPHLVVIGGGLAGMAAALVAADAGARVTMLEARPRLGGATTSFRRGELWIDTGQHVFMRCCTAYRGLIARLGVTHLTTLQPRLDVPVLLGATQTRTRLRRTGVRLPAPLHLAPALLGYKALPLAERVRAGLAAFQLGRLDERSPRVDSGSFGAWLASHGQGPAATSALWELLTVATLNLPADEASLGLAAKVVRTGLLEAADAGDIGWAEAPLSRLHGDAALAALTAVGADVRTGVKVRSVTADGAGWRVAVTAGGTSRGEAVPGADPSGSLYADAVVLATPAPAAAGLLPDGATVDARRLHALGDSPIINVHMIYPRQVIEGPFLAVVDSPIQWIFDRTISSGLAASGPPGAQYLALSQSAAEPWINMPAGDVATLFTEEMARLFPAARAAEPIEVFVTRERTATFRQVPGSLALRPGASTGLAHFALAGTYTDTGWPATMESAVRSGVAAARESLAGMGVVVGDLADLVERPSAVPAAPAAPAVSAVSAGPAASAARGGLAVKPRQASDDLPDRPEPSDSSDFPDPRGANATAAGSTEAVGPVTTGQQEHSSTGGFPV